MILLTTHRHPCNNQIQQEYHCNGHVYELQQDSNRPKWANWFFIKHFPLMQAERCIEEHQASTVERAERMNFRK